MQDHTDDSAAPRGCPPWCVRDHRPDLPLDDQHHTSRPRRVPVLTGRPALDPDDLAVGDAVVVRLLRRTQAELTWLEAVSEEGDAIHLVATVDTARRLLAVLHELVTAASA